MTDVPATTEAATPSFLTEALREGGVLDADTTVAEVDHEPIGVGVGIVGQLARLQLRYEGQATGAPGMVVLKMPSQFAENRAVGDHFNFYEREGRFYQQIGAKVDLRTPRCYWNHIDPATKTFGLLLEDLGARTMISQVEGMGAERAAEALGALAALHGTWWASPALDGLDWMPRMDDPINLAAGQQYRESWPLFVERVGDALPEGALELGVAAQERFEDLMRTIMDGAPSTICHGDFRVDNLLFDDHAPEGDRVAVIDWQISSRGPAIGDVAYFLCQSMAVDERRRHEEELVRGWYGRMVDAVGTGLADYPFDLAWHQYQRAVLFTTVYPVVAAGSMDPANERGRELVTAMAVRSFSAALDMGCARFVP
jgi:hypothetical protein